MIEVYLVPSLLTDDDLDGMPVASRHEGWLECDMCDGQVELRSDTEEWQEIEPGSGRYRITGYGPPVGICCGLLYAVQPDGRVEALRLRVLGYPHDAPFRCGPVVEQAEAERLG